MFDIQDYEYDLPEELIAQVPVERRDQARLLFVDRSKESFSDRHFYELPYLLKPGDLLVVNNTRVIPARLFGRKESGGRIEVLVLEHAGSPQAQKSNTRWCLSKSAKRPRKGSRVEFGQAVSGFIEDVGQDGFILIRFEGPTPFSKDSKPKGKGPPFSIDQFLEEKGAMPLPPYIKRDRQDDRSTSDRERYQTIFSQQIGAVAAPTAGLHFTKALVEKLSRARVSLVALTLHVGHGTFKPVRTRDIRKHELGEEDYVIESVTAETINRFKMAGKRIIAVGTTVVRTLETVAGPNGEISGGKGRTNLLITPGFRFRVIDGMLTNFHLPRSSLLFLVSAFAGLQLTRKAYQWAVTKKYRFYSYGDAMLIL